MKKLVLTGAAGRLGSYLREPLSQLADTLVSSDLADDIGTLYPGETYVKADLSELGAMTDLLKDADMVVHFGAIGDEAPWDAILQSNIVGRGCVPAHPLRCPSQQSPRLGIMAVL